MVRSSLLLFAFLFLPLAADAHGGRPSFEQQVGPYLIDVGYDTVGFRPDEPVTFDFQIWKEIEAGWEPASFSGLTIRIEREGELVHEESPERAPLGWLGTAYAFPEEGEYTFVTIFREVDGGEDVRAEFPVTVAAEAGRWGRVSRAIALGVSGAAMLVFFIATFLFVLDEVRRRRKSG